MNIRKCPYCGESDYTPGLTTSTAMYYPPRIVNGVNINPDRNSKRQDRRCNSCNETTTVEMNKNLLTN